VKNHLIEEFLKAYPQKTRCILFSNSRSPPPDYNLAAKPLQEDVYFGHAFAPNAGPLKGRFGVTEVPTLVVIPRKGGKIENFTGDKISSPSKIEAVLKKVMKSNKK
jgi:hypothetical protein